MGAVPPGPEGISGCFPEGLAMKPAKEPSGTKRLIPLAALVRGDLLALVRQLGMQRKHPSASLREGLDETLTGLGLFASLTRSPRRQTRSCPR